MVSAADLLERKEKVCVVGLGYVGLPLAVLLSEHLDVVGFDIDAKKIERLEAGVDITKEVADSALKAAPVHFSSNPEIISDAAFIIVAVPTPITKHKEPDLAILSSATEIVGKHMKKGAVVVFESTVYPGVTEEVCLPILERASGMTFGEDFTLGYSPERVNPGDKEHTIDKVIKVVSASDEKTLDIVSAVYGTLTNVYKASSIKVAEAAKVIENTQRDINIALMNELAVIFGKMDINTYEVLEAAGTKWNFLSFKPGLVGGHCIGVDPYYLTYKAKELGHHPEVILSGRSINDAMPKLVAEKVLKSYVSAYKKQPKTALILGATFKENISDIRNSKVIDMYNELVSFGLDVQLYDPVAHKEDVAHEYAVDLTPFDNIQKSDIIILAVPHKEFLDLQVETISSSECLLFDVKKYYDKSAIESLGISYQTL